MKLHYGFDDIGQINWGSILPIIVSFLLIGFLLILIALVDLHRHRTTRENVLLWTIVIVFFNTLGPILYFVIGRKDVNKHAIRD